MATPTITWATPAAITSGTALSATQLDATASVPGTFTYTPAAGTVLGAGTQTLSSPSPRPTPPTTRPPARRVTLTVNTKATPTITWATPAAITYGTALSATQLDATASVPGTFAYTPAARHGTDRRHPDAVGDLHADRHHRLHHRQQSTALDREHGDADHHLGHAGRASPTAPR